VALVDALGNLVRCVLLPGQRHDSVGVEPLLHGISLAALMGDKVFDSDWLRAELNERGALAVIPPNGSRAGTLPYDRAMSKWRHLVENIFQTIKEFRRIATRYDKTDTSFRAAIHLVASILAPK
jgi:transposase